MPDDGTGTQKKCGGVSLFTKRGALPCGDGRQQTSAARLQGMAELPAVPSGGLGEVSPNKPGRKSC